jgi:hypothetical protein
MTLTFPGVLLTGPGEDGRQVVVGNSCHALCGSKMFDLFDSGRSVVVITIP